MIAWNSAQQLFLIWVNEYICSLLATSRVAVHEATACKDAKYIGTNQQLEGKGLQMERESVATGEGCEVVHIASNSCMSLDLCTSIHTCTARHMHFVQYSCQSLTFGLAGGFCWALPLPLPGALPRNCPGRSLRPSSAGARH